MEHLDPPKFSWKTWKRVIRISGNGWGPIVLISSLIIIQAALSPITPLIIAEIIDKGFSGDNSYNMGKMLAIILGIQLFQTALHAWQDYLIVFFTSNIILNVRKKLHHKLINQNINFFTETKIGEFFSRLTSEVDSIGDIIFKPIIYTIQTILSLIATLIAMFLISWQLSALMLVIIPFLFIPMPLVGKLAYKLSKKLVENISSFNSYLAENLSINGIMLSKLFGRKNIEKKHFERLANNIRTYTLGQTKLGIAFDSIFSVGIMIAPLLIYWFGRSGGPFEITAGIAVAFSGYISSLFNPIQQIGQLGMTIKGGQVHFERLFEYLDLKDDNDSPNAIKKLADVKGRIEFRNVSFKYDDNNQILNKFNLVIEPKDKVALVGYSGAGKTTIAYLITKLYEANEGEIFIDHHNIKELDPENHHNVVGMISQEVYLLHSTIRENILISKPDASEEELIQAAQMANIHNKIISLPQGYDTVVGERGYKLSGGEKQRIAIARTFLQNPPIIILDEATSALDAQSEYAIQKALETLTVNRTVIVIAHRLSTIESCNKIVVLEKGKIVEMGHHDELIRSQGIYSSLHQKQYKKQVFS
ncbi:ABC transporter ATP-binding protein [Metabacillus fastidiosus]|uniref:ABC transporter ATP-binding protein n=1 Tax=Metabacillus fastidiosus TaxID=1458 RepID=UPI002E2141E9|nr:ABC transporter ATP-binding protein [Metabacillus fastidiosus]